VILQNFCPKPGTPLGGSPVPGTEEICATIRLARDILQPEIAIQIPPNLTDAFLLIPCGVDDLGGVSPLTIDYVNPEHPWPALEELKMIAGYAELRERLCIYPRYIERGWYHADLQPLINRLGQTVKARSSGR
jgi:FO synthase subunit 1